MSPQRVSVVIPTYARDTLLAQSLASLANQTVELHEVVVVDDGGSGSARDVVERHGPRFRYLWQPNGGQPRARNLGARAATGEWIAFLDDDDLWMPQRHAQVAELIATDRVDLISGDFTKFGDGWTAPTGVFEEIAQQSPGFWDGIARAAGQNHSVVGKFPTSRLIPVSPFWPSAWVVRRDLFDRLNGWNENLRGVKSEDNEFCFRAIQQGQLGIIWLPSVYYRSHSGNESASSLLNAIGRVHVWKTLVGDQKTTDAERACLNSAIDRTQHEIVWAAFEKREFEIAIKTAEAIRKEDLNAIEKLKLSFSRIFAFMKSRKSAA